MDDIIELNLSQSVNVTNTASIRSSVAEWIERDGLDGPPIELMRFHVLVYCTAGVGQHMVDFDDYEMTPGTAMWIRPGQVQQWSNVHDDFSAEVVVFQTSSVPDLPLFDYLHGKTAITDMGEDADRLRQQIEWMSNDLQASQDEALAAAVVGVLLRLFARHAGGHIDNFTAPGHMLATDFVASIDQNIEQRSVAWHAQQIGASTRSVARATAEALGQSPKDVIGARVILEAQRRLAWSNDDIATIARSLRFSEASNFTKFFRRRTGISPSEFREAVNQLETSKTDSERAAFESRLT